MLADEIENESNHLTTCIRCGEVVSDCDICEPCEEYLNWKDELINYE
jgi:hypothetical protein